MFPPVDQADEQGLLCWGGNLTPPVLEEAYHHGIFPWPVEGYPLLWFAPPLRAVLFSHEFHVSRRLQRRLRRGDFEIRRDTAFAKVIEQCATVHGETWITPAMQKAYCRLHRLGVAHSIETWQGSQLVGGLYGVSWGRYFGGESMFHLVPDASKAALAGLMDYIKELGGEWVDCQLMTPFFTQMGAREVPRQEFTRLLATALTVP